MAQEYLTLEEAARKLGMAAEELSQMRERKEIRGFADRGTWRFRAQDIEELARRRGLGSNPDLPLAEVPVPAPHDSPAKRPAAGEQGFPFSLGSDDQVEIGQHIQVPSTGSKSGSKSGPKSPSRKPGSDSDVRLVADGSDLGFQLASDSDVKLEEPAPTPRPAKRPSSPDSSVRRSRPGSDSDVKIVADSSGEIDIAGARTPAPKHASDSDVRLEITPSSPAKKGGEESFLTEEIDLDAELRKAEEASQRRAAKPKSGASPFELSDPEMPASKAQKQPAGKPSSDSSSDFDLSLDSADLSPLEPSSGDVDLSSHKDEEVALGEMHPSEVTGTSDSGINLQEPSDKGISLEHGDSSEEIEFELSLDAESTPKPAKAKPNVDSSSEFELTLEDSARLEPDQPTAAMPVQEEKDIFETDFDVPALEDSGSGSQAVPLEDSDTDLESSDFDLALSDADMVAEEESGSQVVALEDEEEVDESAATVARPRRDLEEGEESGEFAPEEVEALGGIEQESSRVIPAVGAAAPADWGTFVPVTLMVSTFVMFFVAIMSLELVRGMSGFHQPNKASSTIIRMIGPFVPTIDSKDLDKD